MSGTRPSAPADDIFAEIEATLSRTPQGRAFLADHARRSRAADTQGLIDAVARLEAWIRTGSTLLDPGRIRGELADMAEIIRAAREGASGDVPARVEPEAEDDSDILDAAERIQETAWQMREGGFDATLCDRLDELATRIYHACARRGAIAKRSGRAAAALDMIETRVAGLDREVAGRPGGQIPLDEPEPVIPGDDIDFVLTAEAKRRDEIRPAGQEDVLARREAARAELERLATLGTRDRLLRFT